MAHPSDHVELNDIYGCFEAWYDMRPDAEWKTETLDDVPSPYVPAGSPLFSVPGLASPARVLIDSAHSWHIGSPS